MSIAAAPTPRKRAEDVASDLLDGAAIEFATYGFEGASTRRIAERAGAHQPQINYHFSSKEQLWRETVSRLFDQLQIQPASSTGVTDLVDLFVLGLRQFIKFSAEHPELNRIINLEATGESDRLIWLVETHLKPLNEFIGAIWLAIRKSGRGADLTPAEVWEIITSYGALHFANAPMLSRLDKSYRRARTEGPRQADRVINLLFPDRL